MKRSDNMQNKPKNKQMLNKKKSRNRSTHWYERRTCNQVKPGDYRLLLSPITAACCCCSSHENRRPANKQSRGQGQSVPLCVSVQKGNEMAGHTVGFAPALLTMTIWTERRWDHRGILSWHRVRVCFHAGKPTQLFTCVWIPHEDGRILAKDSCPEPPVIRLTLAAKATIKTTCIHI